MLIRYLEIMGLPFHLYTFAISWKNFNKHFKIVVSSVPVQNQIELVPKLVVEIHDLNNYFNMYLKREKGKKQLLFECKKTTHKISINCKIFVEISHFQL